MDWTMLSKSKDIYQVQKALTKLDIYERDARGRTPLLIFLTNRAPLEAIKLLLDNGAELEAADRLGETPLKKAVKFQQKEAVELLLAYGATLDAPGGILESAWNIARFRDFSLADLLIETMGAVRLTLTKEEDKLVDDILHQASEEICESIKQLSAAELLHAVVQRYNWDNGVEPMLAVFKHSACMEITILDMYDLLEGDSWLEVEVIGELPDAQAHKNLAEKLKPVVDAYYKRLKI